MSSPRRYANIGHSHSSSELTFDTLQFDTTIAKPAHSEGLLFYDNSEFALAYYNDEADITLELGRENWVRVRNTTGSTITNGSAVYINGAQGANLPTIALAKADTVDTARAIGIATHDIENNSNGYVTTLGVVRNVDTSGFSAGDVLFLSPTTAGALQNTRPTTGWAFVVGYCTISNVTVGEIKVIPGITAQRADVTSASQNEVISGAWTFEGSGERLRLKADAAGASAQVNIGFDDSAGTRQGYIGFGSTINQDLYVYSDNGNVQLSAPSGVVRVNGGIPLRLYDSGNSRNSYFMDMDTTGDSTGKTAIVRSEGGALTMQSATIADDGTAVFIVDSYGIHWLFNTYNSTAFAHFGKTSTQAPVDFGSGVNVSMGAANPDVDTDVNIWPSAATEISVKNRLGSSRTFFLLSFTRDEET